jgi:hypothetical protein
MSLVIDIADTVAAELAGGEFSQAFTPERKLLPEYEIADLKNLRVTVVPKAVEASGGSRSASQLDVQVDIGIQKKIGSDLEAEVATLLGVVDEVVRFLTRRPLSALSNVAWVGLANDPIYAPDHLASQRVFTSVLTVTYRVLR